MMDCWLQNDSYGQCSLWLPDWLCEIHQCSENQLHRVLEEQLVQESGSTGQHHMGHNVQDPPPLNLPCTCPLHILKRIR